MTELSTTEQNQINNNLCKKALAQNVNEPDKTPYKLELVWRNIILMVIVHLSAIYGLYLVMYKIQFKTALFVYFLAILSSFGVQCGAHRLWSHRTYKAKLPLQILLSFMFILSLENDIFEWSRDHRVHHKYSETDADPHNAKRGFFFSHVGWLLCKKHPDVIQKGRLIDMSDLENDPLVRFQRRFYLPLVILIWGLFPTYIPYLFWGESLWNAYFSCVMLRYAFTLNVTWCVNSVAHLWGDKPYDTSISPVECFIRHLMFGEGFHNYHHTFPWDYSASELGCLHVFNPATAFIDLFAWMGLAYDLKKASPKVVSGRQQRCGGQEYDKRSKMFELFTGFLTICLIASPTIFALIIR